MRIKNKVPARNGATELEFEREPFIYRWPVFVECLLRAGIVRDVTDDPEVLAVDRTGIVDHQQLMSLVTRLR
jgi:hypothetical protein